MNKKLTNANPVSMATMDADFIPLSPFGLLLWPVGFWVPLFVALSLVLRLFLFF